MDARIVKETTPRREGNSPCDACGALIRYLDRYVKRAYVNAHTMWTMRMCQACAEIEPLIPVQEPDYGLCYRDYKDWALHQIDTHGDHEPAARAWLARSK